MNRILVCGDRHWSDDELVRKALRAFPDAVVIEGEAPGADRIARRVALELGYAVHAYPAQWAHFGKAAGPVRNALMLKDGKPDLVIAFHDSLETSKGTKDMVTRARSKGVPVIVITHETVKSLNDV